MGALSGTMETDAQGFYKQITIGTDGNIDQRISFPTENKFIDKNIRVEVEVPRISSSGIFTPTTSTALLNMGSRHDNGNYYPTTTVVGTVNAGQGGWIENDIAVSVDDTYIGRVHGSDMTDDNNDAYTSGTVIPPTDSVQTITISEGYATTRTVKIGTASTGAPGIIQSGSGTVSNPLSYAYDTTNENYTVTGSGTVANATVVTPGYVSSTTGTKQGNTVSVQTTVGKIALGNSFSGVQSTRKPDLTKQTIAISGVTDAASGSASTTAPASGVYVAVRSEENAGNITATPTVTTAGYGDTNSAHYDVVAGKTKVGAAQSDIHYIPITTTSASRSDNVISYGPGWIDAGSTTVPAGAVTSGAGTAAIGDPTWTTDHFTLTASGTIPAPTVNTAGYLSSSIGTKTANSISGSKSLSVIGLTLGMSATGDHTLGPVITEAAKASGATYEDAALPSETIEESAPASGVYINIKTEKTTATFTPSVSVTSAGYGNADHFDVVNSGDTIDSVVPAGSVWVPVKTGQVTSGTASITSASFAYNSSTSKFDLTGSADVAAPSVNTAGWIGTAGTKAKRTNGATLSASVNKIGIQANLTGTGTKKPSITKHNDTNITASDAATTTKPSSGYYIAVSSAANTGTVQATASVTSAGYGTTTSGEYTTTPSDSLTVGAQASSTTYIPITSVTFANSGTSGTTYTDISSSAPALTSGGYLYINAGYITASKISLAKLVPDASAVTGLNGSYILAGHSAYDNDGALIVGTMQTYDGTYTITPI